MAKRRGHGEGSVYQIKDGRWVTSISTGDRKRKYLHSKTQKEALEKLTKARYEQQQGTLVNSPRQLLKVYLAWWLDEVYKPTVRLSTYYNRQLAIKNHIIPALGHISLQALTPKDVQAFYAKKMRVEPKPQAGKKRSALKPQSVKNLHTILHKALDHAVKWGLISRNVCDLVELPASIRQEMQYLTLEQAKCLLEAAKDYKLEALLTLSVTTGIREGELLSLRWSDVDLEKKRLSVRRTLTHAGTYGILESEAKTAAGKRQMVLPDFVVRALKLHRKEQQVMRQRASKWLNENYVFCSRFGNHIQETNLRKKFKKVLAQAQLPNIRFHDLRHSAATILLAMGVHPKIVQEILGHSNIAITLDMYSHVIPTMHEKTMGGLGNLFDSE